MWPTLIPLLGTLLDKLLPDPTAAADAKLKLMDLAQKGELAQIESITQIAVAQSDVNKVEAGSNRLFVAGWRPFCGWVCAVAIGFKYVGGPLLVMVGSYLGISVALPEIDSVELMPLLFGMLGLGALRTVEKVKGAA